MHLLYKVIPLSSGNSGDRNACQILHGTGQAHEDSDCTVGIFHCLNCIRVVPRRTVVPEFQH